MSQNALQQAQSQLRELIDAARAGSLVPVRLPGQLEAIEALLKQADQPGAGHAAEPVPVDQEAFLKDQAYFVSHAIHELRTPMTNIRGYVDMLASPSMGTLNPMQQQFFETVKSNIKRIEGLLYDVSDTAKLRCGVLKVTPKMDTFKNIAGMVEMQMRPYAEQLGRQLIIDVPSGLPLLNLDSALLAKALTKLVENGLRYNDKDDAHVTLRASVDGARLLIRVIDNGIGMTPHDLEQLGVIYYRSDNEVVRSYKGSGLGVPVAYGQLKLVDAVVDVESTLDVGTTFSIRVHVMS